MSPLSSRDSSTVQAGTDLPMHPAIHGQIKSKHQFYILFWVSNPLCDVAWSIHAFDARWGIDHPCSAAIQSSETHASKDSSLHSARPTASQVLPL